MKAKGKAKKTSSPDKETDKKDFLVVGIGASAGGVKALRQFFSGVPADSGMAYVVVLHLSQKHESNLAEILQRETTMPVQQVTEAIEVAPNHVYVIPPAKHLEMIDGIIQPRQAARQKGVRVPIDRFFQTLAEAYGRKAISVILSGTGSDGSLGLKFVKECDGFAIAQDPVEAEYDGMPRSAIETNMVDVVLPVARMPEKLLFLRDSSERLRITHDLDLEVEPAVKNIELLSDVLTLLRVRTGHDFSNYKRPTIIRRIARRLQVYETDDLASYLAVLRDRPEEVLSLLTNLLINVTNFFRDKDAFAAFEEKVIPELFKGKSGDDELRVWVAGCATGEEAYSLAILLTEHAATLSDPPKIQVFASDVDEEVIVRARTGSYTKAAVSDVSPDRLGLYFIAEDDQYRVRKSIREMVLFASHNILRDPPFSRLDLVACRNVLIYLNRESQERVLNVFHFALRPGGYLFLGSSESAEMVSNLFAPVDKKQCIYRSRPGTVARPVTSELPFHKAPKPRTVRSATTPSNLLSFGQLHHQLIEDYAPPSVLVDESGEILHLSDTAGRFLRIAGGDPSNNLLKLVDPSFLPDVRAALFAATNENKGIEAKNIPCVLEGEERFVDITVRPVKTPVAGALVTFQTVGGSENAATSVESIVAGDEATEGVVRRLEEELRHTKDQLRVTIEQYETSTEELKASNEELQAINEELRSATEELETGKEELQSVNEELTTVNQELKVKIDELAKVNSDLENLMRSTEIATIFLDRNLHIKLYTPPATEIFNVIPSDLGRPLSHITHSLTPDNIAADAAAVLESPHAIEREVISADGKHFIARFLPYKGAEDRTGGVVLTFIDVTEMVAREEQLRLLTEIAAAQKLSDAVLEQMPAGVVVANAKESFVFGNRKMAEILGSPDGGSQMAKDYRTWDLRDSEDRSLAPERMPMVRVLRDRETIFSEEMHLHHGDEMTIVSVNAAPILGPDGKVVAGVVAFEDITRRINAEAELRASEERFRSLFESIDEGFCIIEMIYDENDVPIDYRFLEVSPSFEKQTGLKDAKGRRMREIAPEHEEYWFQIYGKIATTGEPARFEQRAQQLNSWYDVYAFRFGNPKDRQVAVLFNNINARKEAEGALRKSEERLRMMSESFTDYAIFQIDTDGIVVSWNAGAEKIFGYTDEEIVGRPGAILFTPEDQANGIPELEMKTARETGRASDERWHIRKDNSRFYASGVMAALYDQTVLVGYAKIARDLTEQKKTEEELRAHRERLEILVVGRTAELAEANETLRQQMEERRIIEEERFALLQKIVTTQEDERRRIARDMHDSLGQQLTALRLKLASMKTELFKDGRLGESLEKLQELGKRIDSEVNFLVWELRPTILDDLGLVSALDNYVREWSRHFEIPAEFQAGRIGQNRLDQNVETNLYRITQEALNNTYKHARARSANVLIEARRGEIVLVVEDDGIGFDMYEIKRPAQTRRGLGLIGMRERAAIIGGTIEFESSPGKGTTVFVRVPIKRGGA